MGDDAFVGGKSPGKQGRGAEGKTAILVACEHNNGKPGFVAMKTVESVNKDSVRAFAQQTIAPGQTLLPMPSPLSTCSPRNIITSPK